MLSVRSLVCRAVVICVIALVSVAATALAQAPPEPSTPAPGADRYHTLAVGSHELRYALILPDGYDAKKTYPVLIALPPGEQDEQMVEAGLSYYWEAEAKTRGWIVASPINPSWTQFFEGTPDPIAALMDELAKTRHVEGDKFHLAGVSNGGRAAMSCALRMPQRLSSVTVLPGLLPDNVSAERLQKLGGIPIALFAGGNDTRWADRSRTDAKRLTDAGVQASVEILPGEGHVVKLSGKRLFDLLDSRRPKERP
jgi:poly(3-hydroxybutyrate) depolymerase